MHMVVELKQKVISEKAGEKAVGHLNLKLWSDPTGFDPFRFHRSSWFTLKEWITMQFPIWVLGDEKTRNKAGTRDKAQSIPSKLQPLHQKRGVKISMEVMIPPLPGAKLKFQVWGHNGVGVGL